MADVRRFQATPAMRSAAVRRVLSAIPPGGEIVLIAHSLGTVVAAEVLYALPTDVLVTAFVTVGSPLALSSLARHVPRVERRFPYDVVRVWLNVVGAGDPVCGFRGISPRFPAALDAFINTGPIGPAAHQAHRYLEHAVITRTFDWLHEQEHPSMPDSRALEPRIPDEQLLLFIRLHYIRQLERQLKPGSDKRKRFARARGAIVSELRSREADPAVAKAFGADNAYRLRERLASHHALVVLLELAMSNPIRPYQIDYEDDEEERALIALAADLGLPSNWALTVLESEKQARKVHGAPRNWARRAAVAAGAASLLAVAVAAPYLVLAAAPEGAAGAAAFVGGLAALGPGGMAGGLGAIGLAGSLAGGAVGAGVASLSPAAVEETVIGLQALSSAADRLSEPALIDAAWTRLVDMEVQAGQLHSRLGAISDSGSSSLKDAESKLTSIRRALDWLRDHGIGPPQLPPGD